MKTPRGMLGGKGVHNVPHHPWIIAIHECKAIPWIIGRIGRDLASVPSRADPPMVINVHG